MPPKEIQQVKNKGGRPKAAWTPRRDQKAVHLYTLTKLTMLEISDEMKEEGFAPRYLTQPLILIESLLTHL
jgi:hypothetical protein